jgi:hypothetical protein
MILALIEDNTLCVYESADIVPHDIEALDVEESLKVAYDDSGRRYDLEWIEPNKHGRFLGLIRWSSNGQYRLVPTEIVDREGLLSTILRAASVEPVSAAQKVREIELRLKNNIK